MEEILWKINLDNLAMGLASISFSEKINENSQTFEKH